LAFGFSDDQAVAVGLTCGGTFHILVQPELPNYLDRLAEALREETPFAIATVYAVNEDPDSYFADENSDVPVPEGEMGQLLTRGPYTLRGYYRAPEHNARSFTEDGWYRTGDVVRWHPSGNLVVEGRTKDLINRAGEKISAEEVENLIYRLPSVAQVAAIALPDDRFGERTCVVVVLRDGFYNLTLEEIRDAMKDFGVAKYKYPDQLVTVESLPVTNVGKIDKALLRKQLG
jgi:2,3-dihydroxybenzoate-AMP ligase